MIRRILMAMLVLGLALPALAMPLDHAAQPAPQITAALHHDHEHDPQPQPAAPAAPGHSGKHECIGCIVAQDEAAIAAADPVPPATRGLMLVAMPPSSDGKPATPPPKA